MVARAAAALAAAVALAGCATTPTATPAVTPTPDVTAAPVPLPSPAPSTDGSSGPSASPPAPPVAGTPAVVGGYDVAVVPEASGIAVSRRDAGLRWLVDDDPGAIELLAVDADGTTRGVVALVDADGAPVEGRDVEDLAAGPCPDARAATCLWVADTGDNAAARSDVRVHVLAEPDPAAGSAPATTRTHVLDGGAVDVEALVVDPDARPWLLTKEQGRTRVLTPAPDAAGGDGLLVTSATLELPEPDAPLLTPYAGLSVTAADLAPDGTRLLLRTYDQVLELRSPGPEVGMAELPRWEAAELPAPREVQGEALAWLDGAQGYVSVAEGSAAITELVLP